MLNRRRPCYVDGVGGCDGWRDKGKRNEYLQDDCGEGVDCSGGHDERGRGAHNG